MNIRAHMRGDAGLGLVEVVVAMFIFATISLAMLPVMVGGLQQSAQNSTNATANQLASEELELAQANVTCAAITAWVGGAAGAIADADNTTLTSQRAFSPSGASCSLTAGEPATVKVRVTVTAPGFAQPLASGYAIVFLASGS